MIFSCADDALEAYLVARTNSSGTLRGQDLSFGAGWSDRCANTRCPSNRREGDPRRTEARRRESAAGGMVCFHCGVAWRYRPPGVAANMGRAHLEPRGRVDDWRRRDARRGREAQPRSRSHGGSAIRAANRLHDEHAARIGSIPTLLRMFERPGAWLKDPAAAWRLSGDAWARTLALWILHAHNGRYLPTWGYGVRWSGRCGLTYAEIAGSFGGVLAALGHPATAAGAEAAIRTGREVVEARLAARGMLLSTPTTVGQLVENLGGGD